MGKNQNKGGGGGGDASIGSGGEGDKSKETELKRPDPPKKVESPLVHTRVYIPRFRVVDARYSTGSQPSRRA